MKKYKFKAKIQAGEGGGAYLVFPFDTEKEFGTKGKVPVHATLDGVPERSALFRYGPPQHLLAVRKAVREQIGKKPGDTVDVVLWKDDEIRTLEVPAEFKTRMEQEKLLPFFEKLSYTAGSLKRRRKRHGRIDSPRRSRCSGRASRLPDRSAGV
jgi:hypothetical protein